MRETDEYLKSYLTYVLKCIKYYNPLPDRIETLGRQFLPLYITLRSLQKHDNIKHTCQVDFQFNSSEK